MPHASVFIRLKLSCDHPNFSLSAGLAMSCTLYSKVDEMVRLTAAALQRRSARTQTFSLVCLVCLVCLVLRLCAESCLRLSFHLISLYSLFRGHRNTWNKSRRVHITSYQARRLDWLIPIPSLGYVLGLTIFWELEPPQQRCLRRGTADRRGEPERRPTSLLSSSGGFEARRNGGCGSLSKS